MIKCQNNYPSHYFPFLRRKTNPKNSVLYVNKIILGEGIGSIHKAHGKSTESLVFQRI